MNHCIIESKIDHKIIPSISCLLDIGELENASIWRFSFNKLFIPSKEIKYAIKDDINIQIPGDSQYMNFMPLMVFITA